MAYRQEEIQNLPRTRSVMRDVVARSGEKKNEGLTDQRKKLAMVFTDLSTT